MEKIPHDRGLNPKFMRCNNPIGFVKGNRKGYCKRRGIVAAYRVPRPEGEGTMVMNLCQECYNKRFPNGD